jgi:two-component system, chemotaxis family, CheB/CheR fusion protein
VPGCAAGEEAYSIAICLLEFMGNQADCLPIQIFATDINELGLERARAGVYPLSIAKDVSAEQLQRWFSPTDGGYKVNPRVREVCVFAKQNVFKDPPFSKLDLISCRNVLIYFGHLLQKRIFPFLHYALNPHGFLVLGSAETVGGFHDLFAVHDKQHKIYQKRPVRTPLEIAFTARPNDPQRAAPYSSSSTVSAAAQTEDEMFHQVERMILSRYGPNGLLVRDDMEIVQFYGNAGELVEPAPGKASLNLLKMIRQDAAFELRAMMHAAGKDKRPVRRAGLTFSVDGTSRRADVEVLPLSAGPGADNFYFVLLKDPAQDGDGSPSGAGASSKAHDGQPVPEDHGEPARLQAELTAAKDYLQSIIEEQESAHEELKSANEETLTSNEELQSTNEELETAKEELQSANEELTTLNDELQGRNRQMVQVNDDLVNLLGSVNIPIVMLNSNLQIRHFTPTAERVLNLVASDVGRPLAHINFNINVPHLEQMVTEVIQTVVIKQREVRDRQGRWYSLRIRPYLTRENKIAGAMLALLDITELKQTQQRALQTERLAAIGQTVAAIAHESRNMLQQLQWGVDLLQSLVGSSSEAEEALQLIYEQQSNLQRLFDDLQGFAAPIHLERRMAHLGAIWKGAIDAMIPLTKDRRVNIASWPSGPDDYCSLDLFRIQQVFRNLLENSLAACTEPVDIHINCRDTDLHGEPAICLSIRDNGPGLTADQRERVFDAFYTTKPRGTGLGLAICKRIVDAHGGLIEVGAFPERGTEILITLPRQPLP